MGTKALSILAALLAVVAIVATAAWHHASEVLHESRVELIGGTLEAIAGLLQENEALRGKLKADPLMDKDAGILESYLVTIRRDGVAKHATTKQCLDELAENNTAIVTLIKSYAPQARTSAFTREAEKFRKYAIAWRDRWNSVMELFMAGGTYPAAAPPFPHDFIEAVRVEIAAAR